jgi:hypothetical protein
MPSSRAIGAGDTPVTIKVHHTAGQPHTPVTFATSVWGYSIPGFASNGERVYLHARSRPSGLAAFELGGGAPLPGLYAPKFHFTGFRSCCDQPRGRLIVDGISQAVRRSLAALFDAPHRVFLVCDLDAERWIGRYVQPADGIYHDLWVSPDGRYFAAYGFLKNYKKGGRYQHELLIYDLRSLPHDINFVSPDEVPNGAEQ